MIVELMKKETVFAILLGIGAGVLIALWVIRGAQSNNNGQQLVVDEKITPSITISTSVIEPLLISEPEDVFISDKNKITIKGKAKKGSLLIIQSPLEEHVATLEDNEFSQEITLMEGENNVQITSYDKKDVESRSLLIYYVNSQ